MIFVHCFHSDVINYEKKTQTPNFLLKERCTEGLPELTFFVESSPKHYGVGRSHIPRTVFQPLLRVLHACTYEMSSGYSNTFPTQISTTTSYVQFWCCVINKIWLDLITKTPPCPTIQSQPLEKSLMCLQSHVSEPSTVEAQIVLCPDYGTKSARTASVTKGSQDESQGPRTLPQCCQWYNSPGTMPMKAQKDAVSSPVDAAE